ncbi:fatty acid desaturase family protein [Bradymonas sediminis]|uniref:Fatty acid desaturase n=1 Tax=Bradymonas sediminis TaxID=1548548 RepID=A0A2Z4FN46_9DELT|nr:fatty acid desaturase [Bradymonas sediminis]AWV90389.1 fatty acid desaturase [Bradymonas sediminis]TDP72226.1 fatty acid desaturase [Bradymonas sediminis]
MSKPPTPSLYDFEADSAFDLDQVDLEELARELKALATEIRAETNADPSADIAHLKKIERWGKLCTALGYGTAWMVPNPISGMLISQGLLTRWLLMHHISHRGYDKVPGIEAKYTSKVFGKGARRLFDWMDWIHPEAWHEEHDFLHHYHLGEDEDPDLLERNTEWMREHDVPSWLRYLFVGALSGTWKWVYYAPSTLAVMQVARARRNKEEPPEPAEMLSPFNKRGRELWMRSLIPHATWRFGIIPSLFLPLGPVAAANVFLNSIWAEIFTNIHAFLVIGPNHTGEDLYRFDAPVKSRNEFYLRQIVGSANYKCGDELGDWLQMWLNYQIEHHIWPDMTMLQYRKVQPKVKELCERMNIPYVQESVFTRARKMIDVIVGKASMIRVPAT